MSISFKKIIFFFMLFGFYINTYGLEDVYQFVTPVQQQRFQQLVSELRCVVCQNQSLAESNAPLAQDLKKIVSMQIRAGLTNDQIKQYLVQRYGEYILFKPYINQTTFILWLGPLVFLVGAFLIMGISIRRQAQSSRYESLEAKEDAIPKQD